MLISLFSFLQGDVESLVGAILIRLLDAISESARSRGAHVFVVLSEQYK